MIYVFIMHITYITVRALYKSIPSEDPYEDAAQQLFEQAPHSSEYVPRDHVPVFIPEFEHPEDLVSAEESSAAAARRSGPTMAHGVDCSYVETRLQDTEKRMMAALELVNRKKDRAAVRAEIEVLRNERLAYEQEGIQTRETLSRSEAHCKALEARVAVLETYARRLEWQRQAADDFVVEHIMRTQALEARAHINTLEDTGTPPLLPISTISTSRRAGIPKANTPPRNRPLLATPRPGCEVEESAVAARRQGPAMAHGVDCNYIETRLQDTERRMMAVLKLVNRRDSYQVEVCTRESSEFCTRHHDAQKDRAAVRAEIEVLRNERLAYEQDGIQIHEALARSEAHCRALEARVAVLETHVRRLEWQRQATNDFAVEHIMRTQALEAGAHIDTLEDTEIGCESPITITDNRGRFCESVHNYPDSVKTL
nr:hypothetical protein [Tanacetum cinerariifolium]